MYYLDRVLSVAFSQLGTHETPVNKVKYNTWYYGRVVSGKEYPWCMVFLQWVFDKADSRLPLKTASCGALVRETKQLDKDGWAVFVPKTTQSLMRGDILIYDFSKTKKKTEHCGLLYAVTSDGTSLQSIEGNTGTGNDANGGAVMLRKRYVSQISYVIRPPYEKEEDMNIDEFVKKCTAEQAYGLLMKAMEHLDARPEPMWSRTQGAWAWAESEGYMDGKRPESFVKRDELAAVLKRATDKLE